MHRALRQWSVAALAFVLTAAASAQMRHIDRKHPVVDPAAGVALYEKGVLADGQPLIAERSEMPSLSGANAACINCHRKSGLGSVEARNVIPPVTGRYLFHPPDDSDDVARLPYLPNTRLDRPAYDRQTLARAIREGVDPSDKPLSYLMPRYDLSEADMNGLIDHLVALDLPKVPGVTSEELHFATIVTPDADPATREGVLTVIRNFFDEKNAAPRGSGNQKMQTTAKGALAKHMFRVNRQWVLHVWELSGPASTWRQQLDTLFAAEPVFAVLSGAYGADFSPIRSFCESRAVPCLFPNLDNAPAVADDDFHVIYFSSGVSLEADLIAHDLRQNASTVTQVAALYRDGDVGDAAASRLADDLAADHIAVRRLHVPAKAGPDTLRAALRTVPANTPIVLWLRAADVQALGPAPAAGAYLSGIMADAENAPLPAEWRSGTQIVYNVDLPLVRRVRLDYAHGWFRVRKIPEVSFRAQADTFLACGVLSETVKHMIDAFVPDYLVERIEDTLEHRVLTGYYPRLTLGPHQRFASKGGFFAKFKDPTGTEVVPVGDWFVP
jgi:hypothetical protein